MTAKPPAPCVGPHAARAPGHEASSLLEHRPEQNGTIPPELDRHIDHVDDEIGFTRYFYKPQPLRSLDEIRADILALQQETEGLLEEIIGTGGERRDAMGNSSSISQLARKVSSSVP